MKQIVNAPSIEPLWSQPIGNLESRKSLPKLPTIREATLLIKKAVLSTPHWLRMHPLEGLITIPQKNQSLGREPWSSGYGRRLMFERLWVRIPAPYTGWIDIFHIYLL